MALVARVVRTYRSSVTVRDAAAARSEHFLVTGASGSLGAWTVKTLLDQAVEATAVCASGDDRCLRLIVDAERLTDVRRIDADELDRSGLHAAMNGVTHVVHTDPELTAAAERVGVDLARDSITRLDDVLRAAHLAGVEGVSFDSSMAVFAPSSRPVDDHDRPAPADHRGCAHLAREMIAARWASTCGLSNTGLRVGALYGAGHDEGPSGTVAQVVAAAMGNVPFVLDDVDQVDFQFVGDVAAMMCDAARTARGHQVLNLSCGPTSTAQLVNLLTSMTGASHVRIGDSVASTRLASPAARGSSLRLPTDLARGLQATIESIRWAPLDLTTGAASSRSAHGAPSPD